MLLASTELFCPRSANRKWELLGAECHSQRQDSKGSDDSRRRTRKSLRAKYVEQQLRTDYYTVHQEKRATRHGDASRNLSTLESRQECQGELKASLGYIARLSFKKLKIAMHLNQLKKSLSTREDGEEESLW